MEIINNSSHQSDKKKSFHKNIHRDEIHVGHNIYCKRSLSVFRININVLICEISKVNIV